VAKAENLSLFLIHPIFVVTDAVLALHFNVLEVGFRDIFGFHAPWNFVDIHVRRHNHF
jgi:hypothetical protein